MFTQRRRDGKAAGEVLGIHDGEIDLVLFAEILDAFKHGDAPRLRNYISDHEDFHICMFGSKKIENREPWIVNREDNASRFAIHDSRSGRREIRICRSEAVIEPA